MNVLWVHSSTKKDKMELRTAGLPPKTSCWESLISLNQHKSNLKMANNPIREHHYHFIDENNQSSMLACQDHLTRVYNYAKNFFMRGNILLRVLSTPVLRKIIYRFRAKYRRLMIPGRQPWSFGECLWFNDWFLFSGDIYYLKVRTAQFP